VSEESNGLKITLKKSVLVGRLLAINVALVYRLRPVCLLRNGEKFSDGLTVPVPIAVILRGLQWIILYQFLGEETTAQKMFYLLVLGVIVS